MILFDELKPIVDKIISKGNDNNFHSLLAVCKGAETPIQHVLFSVERAVGKKAQTFFKVFVIYGEYGDSFSPFIEERYRTTTDSRAALTALLRRLQAKIAKKYAYL